MEGSRSSGSSGPRPRTSSATASRSSSRLAAAELDAFLLEEFAGRLHDGVALLFRGEAFKRAVFELFDEEFVEADLRRFGLGICPFRRRRPLRRRARRAASARAAIGVQLR